MGVSYFKDFMLNYFFILLPLVLLPRFFALKNHKGQTWAGLLIASASIVLCMISPIENGHGYMYDLRFVPFVIASLYGGKRMALILYVVVVAARFSIGGPGAWLNWLAMTIALPMIVLMIKPFRSMGTKERYVTGVLTVTACTYLTMLVIYAVFPHLPIHFFWATSKFALLQGMVTFLSIYIFKAMRRSEWMKAELLYAEKLKATSDISAAIAHEVRNPLTSVRGFIQMLQRPNLSEEQKTRYLSICLEELDQAQRIIGDYLSFAKPHLDEIVRLNVSEELEYCMQVLDSYARMNEVGVQYDSEEADEVCLVMGDRQKLRQCFVNLLKNGIESMEEGGNLTIRTKPTRKEVSVEISDTGRGMTEEQVRRLGTPFYTTKDKGTGLGTMVAYGIVKSMLGRLEVESSPGNGTRFTIRFPRSQPEL